MSPEQIAYFREIGCSDTVIDRVITLFEEVKPLLDTDPEDVFISDIINAEGVRTYQNVVFFTQSYISEIKNFMTSKNIDFVKSSILSIMVELNYSGYDLKNTTDDSRLKVEATFKARAELVMFATRNNCNHLTLLAQKRFIRPDRLYD